MKIEASQTLPITVDISDDEVYRITRKTILSLIGLQNKVFIDDELVITDGKLYRVYLENYGPYDPDRLTEELRDATENDEHIIKVLEQLKINQS